MRPCRRRGPYRRAQEIRFQQAADWRELILEISNLRASGRGHCCQGRGSFWRARAGWRAGGLAADGLKLAFELKQTDDGDDEESGVRKRGGVVELCACLRAWLPEGDI